MWAPSGSGVPLMTSTAAHASQRQRCRHSTPVSSCDDAIGAALGDEALGRHHLDHAAAHLRVLSGADGAHVHELRALDDPRGHQHALPGVGRPAVGIGRPRGRRRSAAARARPGARPRAAPPASTRPGAAASTRPAWRSATVPASAPVWRLQIAHIVEVFERTQRAARSANANALEAKLKRPRRCVPNRLASRKRSCGRTRSQSRSTASSMLLQKDGARVRRGSAASATRTARPTERSTAPSALRQTWSITCERTLSPAPRGSAPRRWQSRAARRPRRSRAAGAGPPRRRPWRRQPRPPRGRTAPSSS